MTSVNKFLNQLANGDNVRDYDHASRTFVENTFELQPRYKHLFHVVFNFDPLIGQNLGLTSDEKGELHLLVKGVDLPQFQIDIEDRNQYNRHRFTQHRIRYQPVSLSFHDDQADIIRKLWYAYYVYYFQDADYESFGDGLHRVYSQDDIYRDRTLDTVQWGYDRGPKSLSGKRFFSDIRIYSMFQKRFMAHILVNPIITDFSHDRHEYASGELMEHRMTLQYETVKYQHGFVNTDNPAHFAVHHYDTRPSPISPLGGGTNSVFFRGGLIDTTNSIISDLSSGNILSAVLKGNVLSKNARDMDIKDVLFGELKTAGKNVLRGKSPFGGFKFPKISQDSDPGTQDLSRRTRRSTWINPDTGAAITTTAASSRKSNVISSQGVAIGTNKHQTPNQFTGNYGRANIRVNNKNSSVASSRKINDFIEWDE